MWLFRLVSSLMARHHQLTFVEEQYRRVADESPGDGDALPLSAR